MPTPLRRPTRRESRIAPSSSAPGWSVSRLAPALAQQVRTWPGRGRLGTTIFSTRSCALTNHPATLRMFYRIGLYRRIEPRGIIAPIFHSLDRAEHAELVANLTMPISGRRHASAYVPGAQEHRKDRRGGARDSRHPAVDVRLDIGLPRQGFEQMPDRVIARGCRSGWRGEAHRGAPSPRGGAALLQGDLDIEFEGFTYGSRAEHRGRLRFPPARLAQERNDISDPSNGRTCFTEGPARPLARPPPDP